MLVLPSGMLDRRANPWIKQTNFKGLTQGQSCKMIDVMENAATLPATGTAKVAFVWVLHGSRDARYQATVAALEQQLTDRLADRVIWAIGYLECAATSLSEQIQSLAANWVAQGVTQIQVCPLFLVSGVHVMEDIPAAVAAARSGLALDIQVQPYLGCQTFLGDLLAARFAHVPPAARLLVAHGTRRPGGNQPIAALAQQLEAQVAYWFVPPSVPDRVAELYAAGIRQIVVLPYVLVSGALTEGIDRQMAELKTQFPDLVCERLPALDASLPDLIESLSQAGI